GYPVVSRLGWAICLTRSEASRASAIRHTSVTELAWVYVCLGRNADALRVAREAAASMPIEKIGLAQIEAHAGQTKEAVKLLRQLLYNPCQRIRFCYARRRSHRGNALLYTQIFPEAGRVISRCDCRSGQ